MQRDAVASDRENEWSASGSGLTKGRIVDNCRGKGGSGYGV